jgi:tRNA wybutosine-synthesizing protein 2
LTHAAGPEVSRSIPEGYQRLGRVLIVRLPDSLRPFFPLIGRAWQEELAVSTVLRHREGVHGELRKPSLERIAGKETETEVTEYGIRYRFDAFRILFSRGNRTERFRAGQLTRAGETVVDLFAGIGYFAIPAAVHGQASVVLAVEKDPLSFGYLEQNIALNGVSHIVRPILGDNRVVPLASGQADRVFLGYLPSAVPWIGRALGLLRPSEGWLHIHLIADVRGAEKQSGGEVSAAIIRSGGRILASRVREVKPYGPGRSHMVIDVRVVPSLTIAELTA